MAKAKDGVHESYKETNGLHKSARGFEGGACLVKHVFLFKDRDSCSYRWQGVEKASRQPGKAAYNAHRTESYHIGKRSSGPFHPDRESDVAASPGMKGVMVAVKLTKKGLRSIMKVKNFTTGSIPYSNQVHHVLNASSLRVGIDDLAKIWTPIRDTIIDGLFTEKYNLNHNANNIILPTREYDCRQTGLPKHKGDHPNYSARILTAVKQALKPYQTIANQMKDDEDHDEPDPVQLKKDLVAISDTMYSSIVSLAEANRAKSQFISVNDLPQSAFAGLPGV